MALETLKDVTEVNGEKIVVMDQLREKYPDKFNESGAMDYKWFEKDIRPNFFIYVRNDVNSVSFTLQNGPVGEVGKNGCQVTDIMAVCLKMLEGLNQKFPCRENSLSITKLQEAIMWQDQRTKNRITRGVEGKSKV